MTKPAIKQTVKVALGEAGRPVGTLTYSKDGGREFTTFAYDTTWLAAPDRFELSPDLPLVEGHQFRKAPSKDDSVFHFAFADTDQMVGAAA
ncbi:HipA N-terminal domain-containing protein [Trinickia diaoshuihuensis]|uniref:HipA N-terminal domain-containing protein n=1 Tax=Trinickia diaoshuihuensis TaxID=2292265 RepID=UPI001F074ED4|nr:HipA N-terminal domain-containing protein [Trinickia diaoshuihuensis]